MADVRDVTRSTSDVSDAALSTSSTDVILSSPSSQYPRWFLLRRSGVIPVALRTEDVGNAAFDSMQDSGS
jgi:hypothetical protein